MKSLQYLGPNQVEWADRPIPEPGPGQIRARIEGVTTCPHWDLHIMGGEPMFPGRPIPYPYQPGQPGHEAVARVDALGPGVDGPPAGTRVAAWRDQGHDRPGCYAHFNVFEADNLLPIPEDLPLEAVAPLELAMCVQVSFDQLAQLDAVKVARFGVTGLGPAGLIALQMARAYGAGEVVAIDPVASRRELALQLGADTAVAPEELGGVLDAAIDCTGLASAVANLMEHTRRAISTFGVLREPVPFGFRQWAGGLALLGYGSHNRSAAERALALVTGGQLRLAPLVTHTLPLTRYAEGIELLRNKEAIKVLYLPWTE
ncbi:MAG: zinc-binding dehydrogenase [Chloroflexota bacterium]|nr:zinc-binding dehydrogenase [Chloroflexota bacterium]